MNANIVVSPAIHLPDGTTIWVDLTEFRLGYDGEVFHVPCSKEWNLGATANMLDELNEIVVHAATCPDHTPVGVMLNDGALDLDIEPGPGGGE